MLAFFGDHPVAPAHQTGWARQWHATRLFIAIPRLDQRPFTDNAGSFHPLQTAARVGDPPMSRLELHSLGAEIGDVDRIGHEEIAVVWRRPLRQETRGNRDLDAAGNRAIHLPPNISRETLLLRLGLAGIMTESLHGRKADDGSV